MNKKIIKMELNPEQIQAMQVLRSGSNVFLTGSAGTGKSFVVREYLKSKKSIKKTPILASTGAAAVLIQGRTFHSFFGLGIMEGGMSVTLERASQNKRVCARINKADEIIIDEISMIHPQAFLVAHEICCKIRGSNDPFGGIRLILTGDFLQLPPVDRFEKKIPWLFKQPIWNALDLRAVELIKSMRTSDEKFVNILNCIRHGLVSEEVRTFLNSRVQPLKEDFLGSVLFARKVEAEKFNQMRLDGLNGKLYEFETSVITEQKTMLSKEALIGYSPLAPKLVLKEKALVMIRKNDLEGEYVNGSLGLVAKIHKDGIEIDLLTGSRVLLQKEDFQVLDADGKVVATISNFPISLGWATTIHKSQGSSIDRLHVNLDRLWEFGQAYVALSRARNPEELFIEKWSPSSIKADPEVLKFYKSFE